LNNISEKIDNEKLILVDGSGYIFRAYYALPPMNNPDGIPINAVYGFTNMMVKLIEDFNPQDICVLFDFGRETFRNEIYANYKANRTSPPEDLIPQFDLIKQASRSIGLPTIEMEGFEADDLIATFVQKAKKTNKEVIIVSSDKDLMQLVENDVIMLDPMKNLWIDENKVKEKFGVSPDKVIDVQALAGDSSDNIPGVPGIGLKTAQRIIIDLKDKVTKSAISDEISLDLNNTIQNEALSALVALGFSKKIAQQKIDKALANKQGNFDVETLVRESLSQM